MKLTEKHYYSERGDDPELYQYLKVIQESPRDHEVNGGRQFIRFQLMETRYRSKQEASDYLKWASKEIKNLPA